MPCAVLAALVALTNISVSATQPSPVALGLEVVSRLLFAPREPVRLILGGEVTEVLEVARQQGLTIHRTLDNYVVVSASAAQIAALLSIPAIKSIAGDVNVAPMMVVSDRAMGADQARSGGSGLLGLAYPGVTGNGVGVAIVDSGISPHRALANKVVANVSFVPGDSATTDAYGHGTHIAGIVAGLGSAATRVTPEYSGGVAPGAHLVNVRVLGANGSGYTSNVIAGLDWVVANRRRYGIRVVNLSLGHPVTAPCVVDPLCSSIARVVQAGIVVVASAGNRGMTSGTRLFGTITSPGNSPAAITVGALNTFNTIVRTDDEITTYSSRGPTPYDMGVKPDLVAPGNKIVSLEAANSYLARTYSSQHVAGSSSNAYYRMSGTSMAAAMVSGGLALLFEASPGLTALHAKLALQLTASPMDEGLMAAGPAASIVGSPSPRLQSIDGSTANDSDRWSRGKGRWDGLPRPRHSCATTLLSHRHPRAAGNRHARHDVPVGHFWVPVSGRTSESAGRHVPAAAALGRSGVRRGRAAVVVGRPAALGRSNFRRARATNALG